MAYLAINGYELPPCKRGVSVVVTTVVDSGRDANGGKSYYALAEEILKDAGISEYYIDPRLKKLYSNNPIPRVKYKEALQIIANACRCVLTQSRDGKVQIKSNFMPSASIATNGEETYSNAANVLTDTPKVEYATLAGNYTPTDGTMFFLPRNGKAALTTGYVSKEISGANGTFTKNPIVTITMEAIRAYYGLKLVFGTALPAAFTIRTYNGGEPVNEYPVEKDEINTTWVMQSWQIGNIRRNKNECNQY